MVELPLMVAVATHPIQYQAPIWRRLAMEEGARFHAVFGFDVGVRATIDPDFRSSFKWDVPLLEGYAHTFLERDRADNRFTFLSPGAKGLRRRLRRLEPSVGILTAYNNILHLVALHEFRRLRCPVVMRHEASDVAFNRSRWKSYLRDRILRAVYRRIDQFAAIGTEAHRHLRRLGVEESRITAAPYGVDSEFVATQVAHFRPLRQRLRSAWGIPEGDRVLVFSGKLIEKKHPTLIVEALRRLGMEQRASLWLLVAGDGPLREEFERAAREVLGPRALFPGFLNQSEIGQVYASGDLFVLPSRRGAGETWGLVVNEAMQYGLPCLVSDGVGCHPDLILPDRTGWVFPSGDAAELSRRLRQWVDMDGLARERMRAESEAQAEHFSVAAATQGILEAIARCLSAPGTRRI